MFTGAVSHQFHVWFQTWFHIRVPSKGFPFFRAGLMEPVTSLVVGYCLSARNPVAACAVVLPWAWGRRVGG